MIKIELPSLKEWTAQQRKLYADTWEKPHLRWLMTLLTYEPQHTLPECSDKHTYKRHNAKPPDFSEPVCNRCALLNYLHSVSSDDLKVTIGVDIQYGERDD